MKKLLASLLAIALVGGIMAGCTNKDANTQNPSTTPPTDGSTPPAKTYQLKLSGIGGSLNYIPVYIAQEEGWFAEAGLEIEEMLFTNGPVQMEALSANSWDIGCTGVGGVLSGVIGYDALLLGASSTDDGTQYVFARNGSDIVAAGAGNNSISPEIFGDAASWKGKTVLCNTGSVLQYLLIKTLDGFGLKTEDVKFVAMDAPTAYSAFQAGEGDLCVLTGSSGTFNMLNDTENYTAVSNGKIAQTNLMCHFVANKNSYADPEKYEAMKIFMEVYFKSLDWMKANPEKTVEYMVDFSDESGSSMDAETAAVYLQADTYYTLQEAYDMLNTKAEGKDYSVMDAEVLDVLNFFIQYGNYAPGDDEKFMGHTDAKLINEVYAEMNK